MTREKQILEAIKLIAPKDRVACAKFLAKALDDIDATKRQRQHEEDVASKAAIEALGTYQAALERARAAKLALPAGLERDLALLNKISRQDQVDFVAMIKDCDRLRNRAPRARVDLSKLSAAAWAKNTLDFLNMKSPLSRGGKWHKLAAIMYGDPDSDLFHHCRKWNLGVNTGQK